MQIAPFAYNKSLLLTSKINEIMGCPAPIRDDLPGFTQNLSIQEKSMEENMEAIFRSFRVPWTKIHFCLHANQKFYVSLFPVSFFTKFPGLCLRLSLPFFLLASPG